MGLFNRLDPPTQDDLCVCAHRFIEHDSSARFCVKRDCTCMGFDSLSKHKHVRQPHRKVRGQMDSEEG